MKDQTNCSPPNTVIGIETLDFFIPVDKLRHCSPPNTVIGIETHPDHLLGLRKQIVALLIPSSVLKQDDNIFRATAEGHCSPPNTVIGIETSYRASDHSCRMHCSPPNTVIGIETFSQKLNLS